MLQVEEIEAAIEALPREDWSRLAEWFRLREQEQWDEQLDRDAASGRLDFLIEEAKDAKARGLLREWPAPE